MVVVAGIGSWSITGGIGSWSITGGAAGGGSGVGHAGAKVTNPGVIAAPAAARAAPAIWRLLLCLSVNFLNSASTSLTGLGLRMAQAGQSTLRLPKSGQSQPLTRTRSRITGTATLEMFGTVSVSGQAVQKKLAALRPLSMTISKGLSFMRRRDDI